MKQILAEGIVEKEGAYFLRYFYIPNTHVSQQNFPDKTGYEAFINEFQIESLVESDYLAQVLLFAKELSMLWYSLRNGEKIKIDIAETEYGFNVRFYVERENEIYTDDSTVQNVMQPFLTGMYFDYSQILVK